LAFAAAAQAAPRKSRVRKAGEGSVLLEAGLDSLTRKDFTAAIGDFQKLSKARGDSASYFLLGYAYYQRGFRSGMPKTADKDDARETVTAYATAVALDPALGEVAQPYKLWHSLALSYEALGDEDKALAAYKKAMKSAPRNPLLPLYASRLRLEMNDVDESFESLALCLSEARATGHEKEVLAEIKSNPLFAGLLASPAHARLLHAFDASVEPPAPTIASTPRIEQLAEPRAETAKDAYGLRDSIRADPPKARAPLSVKDQAVMEQLAAAAEDYKFRRYRQAIASYGEVLHLNEDSGVLSPPQLAMIHERRGTAYNRLGLSPEAIQELRRSVQDMPFDTAAHYQLALAYAVSGEYQRSIHALNEAFKTSPTPADLRRYMLLAKTDSELEPIRDLPAFDSALEQYAPQSHADGR